MLCAYRIKVNGYALTRAPYRLRGKAAPALPPEGEARKGIGPAATRFHDVRLPVMASTARCYKGHETEA